jgi:hypothetical protein
MLQSMLLMSILRSVEPQSRSYVHLDCGADLLRHALLDRTNDFSLLVVVIPERPSILQFATLGPRSVTPTEQFHEFLKREEVGVEVNLNRLRMVG